MATAMATAKAWATAMRLVMARARSTEFSPSEEAKMAQLLPIWHKVCRQMGEERQ